jgi:hypothetical protein
VTPPEERERRQQVTSRPPPDNIITVTNLDLLNKLFDNIDSERSRGAASQGKTSLGSIKRSRLAWVRFKLGLRLGVKLWCLSTFVHVIL